MTKLKNRIISAKREDQFKVHAPRNPSEPEDFARFVDDLNDQFNRIADNFAELVPSTITPTDYVRKDELEDELDALDAEFDQTITSEGEDEIEPKSKRKRTSRKRRRADELAEAAISNAQPTVAPPNVAAASSIGTVAADGQIRFSYQDHTHGGVLGAPVAGGTAGQVAFFTSSFQIDGDNNLFWDDTNKRLGIGTNSPAVELDNRNDTRLGTVVTTPVSGDRLRVASDASPNGRIYGSSATPTWAGVRYGGTLASPSATGDATDIARLAGYGFDGTVTGLGATIQFQTAEAWASGAQGTRITFNTVSDSSATLLERARISARGKGTIGLGADPAARWHVHESVTGDEVLRLDTDPVATTDDPDFGVAQSDVKTTDATVTTLQTIALTASNTYFIEARIVARRTGGAAGTAEDGAAYIRRAAYKTVAGAATLIGAVQDGFTAEDQAGWDATLDTSGTNVRVRITGAVDNNISWHVTTFVQKVGS